MRISFRQLLTHAAEAVGLHHLPLDPAAKDIHGLLTEDAVHHELTRRMIRSIYKANRCCHLDSEVRSWTTFEALGALRGELLRCARTDVDELVLVESIGAAVVSLFADSRNPAGGSAENTGPPERRPADAGHPVDPLRGVF